jgi:hypothetical protein
VSLLEWIGTHERWSTGVWSNALQIPACAVSDIEMCTAFHSIDVQACIMFERSSALDCYSLRP